MQNFISTETSSQTAMACEQAALFGATPGRDEFDNREIWNEEEALAGIEEAIHILAGVVAPDGTQLADERESLLWGFVNTLHAQVQRLDRGIDKIAPEMKDLGQEQDGSEIKSRELERLTDRVQNLGDRRDAFEAMRDLAAEGYRTETGETWRPRNGSHSSQTGKLNSAAIDARDYLRLPARPQGPRDLRASARGHPGRLHRRQGLCRRHRHLALAGQHQAQVRGHGPAARRRTRCGEDRRKLGREERRAPGRVQAELEQKLKIYHLAIDAHSSAGMR